MSKHDEFYEALNGALVALLIAASVVIGAHFALRLFN